METVTILQPEKMVNGWIDSKFLPDGKDRYYLRNKQAKKPRGGWRHLTSEEIETLVKNDNSAASWDNILVTDDFDPMMIKDNKFYGLVRIGRVTGNGLRYHDLRLPIGITNSNIHSCDIGDDCAIHDVHYLSHYIIGNRCMLFNIQEMATTDHAKFGNGIVKDGESEGTRVRLEIMNETGCRSVAPFDGMITADAYMWAKFIDDKRLQDRLLEITQARFDNHRGYYGMVGEECVIKNSSIIKDVMIGTNCYIKGASKLKNITINSSDKEPSQIGENVIMVNGIVGYGCRIFYSCTAVKFMLGNNCNLKYGARLINSILGDNSTISCCEVLNNLIFPAHEQHHNNSFLVASVIFGQSNLAAGATVGSNHNSRTNDNEIVAGRGFWPGLCSSLKHSSVFASYTLLAKAAYPAEMHIPLPFSLVSNDEVHGELHVMPAFWWLFDMYALARNSWKYSTRDKRVKKIQNIEFDTYAPDSMEEAITGRKLLALWTAKAFLRKEGKTWDDMDEEKLADIGCQLLDGDRSVVDSLEVFGENMEKTKRPTRILRVYDGYHAYGDMIVHYAVMNVLNYLENNPKETFATMSKLLESKRQREWVNMGGQLMMMTDLDKLREDIKEGKLDSWDAIHKRYNDIWKRYPVDKLRHAYLSLRFVLHTKKITPKMWEEVLEREKKNQNYIAEQVYASRLKDYENPFRRATYRNEEEMIAAIGTIEDNSFVKQMREESANNIKRIDKIKAKL